MATRILELDVRAEKHLNLGLDHLLQHLPRPVPQIQQQRIFGDTRFWQRQSNIGIALFGVSFRMTLNITEDSPPHPSCSRSEHSSRYHFDTMTERRMWAALQAKPRPYQVVIAA